jgi:hypothetical protein
MPKNLFGTSSVPTDGSAKSMSAWARDSASKLAAEFANDGPPAVSLLFASTIGTPLPDPSRIEGTHGGRAKVGALSISQSNGVAALLNPQAGLPNGPSEKEMPHRGRPNVARAEQSNRVGLLLKAEPIPPAELEEARAEGRRRLTGAALQSQHGASPEPKGSRKAAVPRPPDSADADAVLLHYQTESGAPAYIKPGMRPSARQADYVKLSTDWFSDPKPNAREPAKPVERREPVRAPWGLTDDIRRPSTAATGSGTAATVQVPALDLSRTNAPVGRSRAMAKALTTDDALVRAASAVSLEPAAARAPAAGVPSRLLAERAKPDAPTKACVQPAGSRPSTAHAMRPDLPAPSPAQPLAHVRKAAERDPTAAGGAAVHKAPDFRAARGKGAFSHAPSLVSPFDQPERPRSDPLATLEVAQRPTHARPATAQADDRFVTSSMAFNAAVQHARETGGQ